MIAHVFVAGLLWAVTAAAAAQSNVYYAERGHWTVSTTGAGACAAFNRPPEEINFAPYNALQITATENYHLGFIVFLWPGAVEAGREYDLTLRFEGAEALTVTTTPMSDFALITAPAESRAGWKGLQTATAVTVSIAGLPGQSLYFLLDASGWMEARLRDCIGSL
jgi:hypothetical protein